MNETFNGKELAQILKEEMADKGRTQLGPPGAPQGEDSRFSTSPPLIRASPAKKRLTTWESVGGIKKMGFMRVLMSFV
jgi:hypothetical protein